MLIFLAPGEESYIAKPDTSEMETFQAPDDIVLNNWYWSPDGTKAVMVSSDWDKLYLVDFENSQFEELSDDYSLGFFPWQLSLFSPDSEWMAVPEQSGLMLADSGGRHIERVSGEQSWFAGFLNERELLYFEREDDETTLYLYNFLDDEPEVLADSEYLRVITLNLDSNEVIVQIGPRDSSQIVAINVESGDQRELLEATENTFYSGIVSADGAHLLLQATIIDDGSMPVYHIDLDTGDSEKLLSDSEAGIQIFPSRPAALVGFGEESYFVNLDTDEVIQLTFPDNYPEDDFSRFGISYVEFSPAGDQLLYIDWRNLEESAGFTANLINALEENIFTQSADSLRVQFSPDGEWLGIGYWPEDMQPRDLGVIDIVNINTGERIEILEDAKFELWIQ